MSDRGQDPADQVQTDGGVSAFTGEPFVTMRLRTEAWQWTTGEARAFALLLIRTADAAEDDAALLDVLTGSHVGLERDDRAIGGMLAAHRAARGLRFGKPVESA